MSEDTLPTKEELAELPKPLIVAYAVAAAERIFVFAEEYFRSARLNDLRRAIDIAIEFSKTGNAAGNFRDTIYSSVQSAITAVNNHVGASEAAKATFLAVNTVSTSLAGDDTKTTKSAADSAGLVDADHIDSNARSYFERLKELAKTSDVLNIDIPIWPDGEPDWHKELKEKVAEKRAKEGIDKEIEIYIDPGSASKETIQEVMDALSNYHMAAGGLGLEFATDEKGICIVGSNQP